MAWLCQWIILQFTAIDIGVLANYYGSTAEAGFTLFRKKQGGIAVDIIKYRTLGSPEKP